MKHTIWTSPIASQEIVDGPEATIFHARAVIRFRGEDEGEWHQIGFSDVVKFVFTEFSSCTEEHLDAYDKLLDLEADSQFARDAIATVRRDATGLRHFRIFFDDVGAYDVIARAAEAS
jgi:hypothetical protein